MHRPEFLKYSGLALAPPLVAADAEKADHTLGPQPIVVTVGGVASTATTLTNQ
jgi:hypothetical protein